MERKTVTIDEIIATFSSHIEKHYPSPKDFRRNFDLLLKGKRERTDEGGVRGLAREEHRLSERSRGGCGGARRKAPRTRGGTMSRRRRSISSMLEAIEKKAHETTAQRHREAFVEGSGGRNSASSARTAAGGRRPYLDKLEFNYRYLMTLRIFLFEFISVLAAIRSEYSISGATAGAVAKDTESPRVHRALLPGERGRGRRGAPPEPPGGER